jgi:hypothetical protein
LERRGPHAAAATQSLEWITDPDRFAAIAPEWDHLAARQRSPLLMSSWIQAWCEAFAGPRQVLIAALWA